MAFLFSSRRLAASGGKLPFILVASAPLHKTSSLFASSKDSEMASSAIARQLQSPVLCVTSRREEGGRKAPAMQKEAKKRGFNAIIRWCAYHQEKLTQRRAQRDAKKEEEDARHMDAAVLRWVHESANSFSCGQSLVVLSFLCDVLHRQRERESGTEVDSTPSPSHSLTEGLTHSIAVLLERAVTSEQLELQPFFILLSAVYGLWRVVEGNPLQLEPLTLESINPPSALWLPLLHQLRAFCSVTDVDVDQMDTGVSLEAILTVLLIFDESRCKMYFASNDFRIMENLARRLVRRVQPALAASRAARLRREDALAAAAGMEDVLEEFKDDAASDLSARADERVGETEVKRGNASARMEEATVASLSSSPTDDAMLQMMCSRIDMGDCRRILTRVRLSSLADRVELLEYFLCVVHNPATLTLRELQQLPALFGAAQSVYEVQNTGLADYVVAIRGVRELELLGPLLPYMKDVASAVIEIQAQLRGAAAARACTVAPEVAMSILLSVGRQLQWSSRTLLLRSILMRSPEVLRVVEAALRDSNAEPASLSLPPQQMPQVEVATQANTKVALSQDLCVVLRYMFVYELKDVPYPLPPDLEKTRREELLEVFAVASAVVRCIDWPHCAPAQLFRQGDDVLYSLQLFASVLAYSVLTAYLQSRYIYHFLGAEDDIEDRVLLNTFVVPLLRGKARVSRARTIHLFCELLPRLKTVQFQRQLLERAVRYSIADSQAGMLHFAVHFIVPATELRVYFPAQLDYIFGRRRLVPQSLPVPLSTRMNYSKAYTTILIRVLRYAIDAGVFADKKGNNEAAQRREVACGWCAQYFSTLSSESRQMDLLREQAVRVDDGEPEGESPEEVPVPTAAEDMQPDGNENSGLDRSGNSSGNGMQNATEDEEEDGGDLTAEGSSVEDGDALDPAFTSPVTEDDLEAVLTLMLEAGIKGTSRMIAFIAGRLRDKALTGGAESPTAAAALWWLDQADAAKSDGGGKADESPAYQPPLHCMPLPAHFVFAVRGDSALPIPLTLPYVEQLLTTCDIRVFHHVLSAFFVVQRRRQVMPVLQHEMEVAALAMDILQKRLTASSAEQAVESEEEASRGAEVLSKIAFKSLVHLLYHLSQLPSRTPHLRELVEAIQHPSSSPSEAVVESTTNAISAAEEEDAEEGEGNVHDRDEDAHVLLLLRRTHTKAAPCVLQVTAFINTALLKEFALAHLRRFIVFFPDAAAFAFLQVRPQLCEFTQRELLQVATQYPAGAADLLAELTKMDMSASVGLAEFLTVAKKLPMQISEAVVLAHVARLTITWVTRILSALATRHEEMPESLLQALLSRVEEIADTATESDKSLLLLILQGYLLFRPQHASRASAESESVGCGADGRGAFAKQHGPADEQNWMEDIILNRYSGFDYRTGFSLAAQRHRIDLVRRCCDQLLSLEQISTLDELRYFLVSYPPSLHQLRERGVVAAVEQKLLPAMLSSVPVRWAELEALVSLLSEHNVLLPHTIREITTTLFARASLERLQQASLSSMQSDSAAVLTGCLRIAITCADAAITQQPSSATPEVAASSPFSGLVDTTLSAFDVPQDWLSALTTLVSGQGKAIGHATSASSSPSMSVSRLAVSRHLCALLLEETEDLNPSEFARLVQCLSRLKAWDLAMPATCQREASSTEAQTDFPRVFCAMFERADAHSRCVLLRAIVSDAKVSRCFESVVFRVILNDVALLSDEDLEVVLTAALQLKDMTVVEPLLDAVGTRLLPMMSQCRRSTLVRLLQCHAAFHVTDKAVATAALSALDRQSSMEVKLDAAQVIAVLQSIALLPPFEAPERFLVLSFQRLEKLVSGLSPPQLYQVGQLILDLEMGYIPCVNTLVTTILESRDGPRGHPGFQQMAEALCDVFDVEIAAPLRTSRLRKRRQKARVRDFYALQRKVVQDAKSAVL